MSQAAEDVTPLLGVMREVLCPACNLVALQRSSVFVVTSAGLMLRVGEVAVCGECGFSPYASEREGIQL